MIDGVVRFGVSLRTAQEEGDAEAFRELGQQRQGQLTSAVHAAKDLASELGAPLSAAAASDVEQTLRPPCGCRGRRRGRNRAAGAGGSAGAALRQWTLQVPSLRPARMTKLAPYLRSACKARGQNGTRDNSQGRHDLQREAVQRKGTKRRSDVPRRSACRQTTSRTGRGPPRLRSRRQGRQGSRSGSIRGVGHRQRVSSPKNQPQIRDRRHQEASGHS